MTHRFDLNVENMSRDKLIENYFNAVSMAEELRNGPDEALLVIMSKFGLTKSQSTIFNLILSGRTISPRQALAAVGSSETANLSLTSVYICNIRKTTRKAGLKIINVHGEGYVMFPDQIKRAKQIISGEIPFDHTAEAVTKAES